MSRLRNRILSFLTVMAMTVMCLCVSGHDIAYALPHTVQWVTDSVSNHITGTTLYVTNVSASNGSISNVSGGMYKDDTTIKCHDATTGGSWVMTYSNAGYDVNGKTFDVKVTCTASFPDAGHRPHEGMQVMNIGLNTASSTNVHTAIRMKIDILDKSGNSLPGTFGMTFSDLDVKCPDSSLYDEGVELVSGCGSTVWVGEEISASEGHARMDVYEHDGHTIINASHLCDALNDSCFSIICTSGAQLIWRGGHGLGSTVGIRSSTTVYPSWNAPVKSSTPATVSCAGGVVTYTIT